MSRSRRRTRNFGPVLQFADGVPHALAQGTGEAANRVVEAVESARSRIGTSAKNAGDRARELTEQLELGDRAGPAQVGDSRLNLRGLLWRARAGRQATSSQPVADANVNAQLAKTSRELAHESSDLGMAVESLNGVIRANRKVGARGRTRMIAGLAVGAVLMYHLDIEHGRERRAETARRLITLISGH